MKLFNLFGAPSFSHGVHPPSNKGLTAHVPIKRLPFPPRLVIPLNQHIGTPARAIVKKGEEVVRGQPIAEADGIVSVPIHAPATGRIKDIRLMSNAQGTKAPAILLDVYEASTQEVLWQNPVDPSTLNEDELRQAIRDTGMVGLGGAAFPSHIKLSVPEEKSVETLIVNGCECEPYLSCDHRIMLENTDDLLRGIKYAMQATGTSKAIIGIEDNKMDAVKTIKEKLPPDSPIKVRAVETKYPQGSEKMLIQSLLHKKVPTGGIPADIGVVVNNVGTLAGLGSLLPKGRGLIERVITVTGPGVKNPGNYLVPIGTPIGFILEHAGYQGGANEFILGGPMMGPAVSSMETPITKGTSGLLVLNEPGIEAETRQVWHCIKCGRCVAACPMHLNPAQLGQLAAAGEYETMAEEYHLNDCFECGCCSYICPSNIPLVQYFRIGKAINRERAA